MNHPANSHFFFAPSTASGYEALPKLALEKVAKFVKVKVLADAVEADIGLQMKEFTAIARYGEQSLMIRY